MQSMQQNFSGFFNDAQLKRLDAVGDGLNLIAETYLMSLSSPWKRIANNIDRNLLKSYRPQKNKFLSRIDEDPLAGF